MLFDFLSGAITMGFFVAGPVLPALLEADPRGPVRRVRARLLAARARPGPARLHRHPGRGAQLALSAPPRGLFADPLFGVDQRIGRIS